MQHVPAHEDVRSEPSAMDQTSKHIRVREPLKVGARLGETAADAFHLTDPETATDQTVELDAPRDDVATGFLPWDLATAGRESRERSRLLRRAR